MPRRQRSSSEMVVLILAWSAGGLIVISGLAIILVALVRPTENLAEFGRNIADIINTVVGALIGYLAGSSKRDTGPRDPNPPEPPTQD